MPTASTWSTSGTPRRMTPAKCDDRQGHAHQVHGGEKQRNPDPHPVEIRAEQVEYPPEGGLGGGELGEGQKVARAAG